MDKEDIKKLVNNPNAISGIHNYCDRWCERCPFTSRCANFAIGEHFFPDSQDRDLENEQFWNHLHDVFQLILEMVKETAEKEGVDLDSLDLEAAAESEKQLARTASNHESVHSAEIYSKIVEDWFNSAKDLFTEKGETLAMQARLQLPNSTPLDEAASLKDATEVIRWHQHQIYAKLMRAVEGALEETTETEEGLPKDSDGSAKVALIGIDRSIASWGTMLRHCPDQEKELLKILVHLERLRRRTEECFPDARAFVRPGFDKKQ